MGYLILLSPPSSKFRVCITTSLALGVVPQGVVSFLATNKPLTGGLRITQSLELAVHNGLESMCHVPNQYSNLNLITTLPCMALSHARGDEVAYISHRSESMA